MKTTKTLFLLLASTIGFALQAQTAAVKKQILSPGIYKKDAELRSVSVLKPSIATPPPDPCPACILQIVRRSTDIWDVRVSGYMDIQYFTQNSIAIMESPKLTLYTSSGAIIDVIALSEERVEYRSSWENGHPVSGSGAVNRQPVSASITWKVTYTSGRVSSVTEQIPIR